MREKNDMGCLCWSVLKKEHRFLTYANFSQVKKSEETRIVLDCDFDKIETILQQVKPANHHCSPIQLKCHSEKFIVGLNYLKQQFGVRNNSRSLEVLSASQPMHSMHPFLPRRTKLTC